MPTVCWTEVTHVDETQYWGEKNHEKQSHLTLPQNRTKAKERGTYSYSESKGEQGSPDSLCSALPLGGLNQGSKEIKKISQRETFAWVAQSGGFHLGSVKSSARGRVPGYPPVSLIEVKTKQRAVSIPLGRKWMWLTLTWELCFWASKEIFRMGTKIYIQAISLLLFPTVTK